MNEKEYTTISISDNLRTVSVTSHKEGLNIEQFRELLKDACKASGWLEIQVLDIFNELNEDLPEHQLYRLRIGGRFNAAYTLLAAAAVNLVET